MGSMIMATMATATAQGHITGGGPKDFELRAAMKREGWQEYSIKVGDKYYSYNRLEPLGMTIGVAADTAEILGQLGMESGEDLALAAVLAIAKNTTSKTWVRGLSETLSVLQDPDRYGAQYVANYARTLVPRAVAQAERSADPTRRETWTNDEGLFREVWNGIKSQVPGWSDGLPASRNLWGEKIIPEGGLGPDIMSPIYTSTERESPVDAEMVRMKTGVRMPMKTQVVHGIKVPLTPHEYEQLMVTMNEIPMPQTGRNLKDTLDAMVTKDPEYRVANDDRKDAMIRSYINQARHMALEGLYYGNPEIRRMVDRLALEQQLIMAR